MRSLAEVNGNPVFDAQPSPTVVLDTDFVIQAANHAYVAASGRALDDLLGVNIFEAFPDNPDDPEADGVAKLHSSLERVLRSGRAHNMLIQRYDIPDPEAGHWVRRYWSPVNSPIVGDGRVVGVMHQVEDVTPLHLSLDRVLEKYSAIVRGGGLTDREAAEFVAAASAFATSATDHRDLLAEVDNLRRALVSRSTIDQAKGVIMAERRCSPEAAFNLLKGLSQDTNVRVADVAAALVYQAQVRRGEASPA
jgi:two-component system, response regulator / RNA-binding antiterminator